MTSEPPPRQPLAITVPEEIEAGVYANLVSVWHTPTEFALDFLTIVPGNIPVTQPDGSVVPGQKVRAVARVKLPPAQIWELMKALENQLSAYESEQQAVAAQKSAGEPGDVAPGSEG